MTNLCLTDLTVLRKNSRRFEFLEITKCKHSRLTDFRDVRDVRLSELCTKSGGLSEGCALRVARREGVEGVLIDMYLYNSDQKG